jgi:peroxiredoxin
MTIAQGDRLPEAELLYFDGEAPGSVQLSELVAGKRAVIFGVPGAFTRTCTAAHVPSFIRTMDGFRGKGIDTVICVAVNDPFVMKAWAESTGAEAAGITMLGDASGDFVKALGLSFDGPPVGFYGRSKRFAMLVNDGVVEVIQVEDSPGECSVSAGEALLEAA